MFYIITIVTQVKIPEIFLTIVRQVKKPEIRPLSIIVFQMGKFD